MVLGYLPTFARTKSPSCVGKYTSTMVRIWVMDSFVPCFQSRPSRLSVWLSRLGITPSWSSSGSSSWQRDTNVMWCPWSNLGSQHGGFHGHGGTPIAGWFSSWKIPLKRDDFSGYPYDLGNLHILVKYIHQWIGFHGNFCTGTAQKNFMGESDGLRFPQKSIHWFRWFDGSQIWRYYTILIPSP